MAIGDIGTVQDTFDFETTLCQNPCICHVSGEIYAIHYEISDDDGMIATVKISSAGVITEPFEDSWVYETGVGAKNHPAIIHAFGDIYLIAYYGTGGSLVKSFSIAANGTITKSFLGTFQIAATQNRYFDLVHVSGLIFAVISQYATSIGYLDSFSCSLVGALAGIAQVQMSDGIACEYARITEVYDNYFAITYKHGIQGKIAVAHVTNLGAITRTATQVFGEGADYSGYQPCKKVAPGVIAVAFGGLNGDGYIQTISISSAGLVTNIKVDDYEFDTVTGFVNDIITFGSNWFLVIYIDDDGNGEIKSFYIANNGAITEPYKDTYEFEDTDLHYGRLAPFQLDSCIVVVYQGPGNHGFLRSIAVESPPVGVTHHEMIMGMGP